MSAAVTPVDTNPAGTLRRAAARLRTLAAAIDTPEHPDLPWSTTECANDLAGNCPCIVIQGPAESVILPEVRLSRSRGPAFYVADAETPEVAAFIAAMHPGVAAALAKWLEDASVRVDQMTYLEWRDGVEPEALAVAHAILGEQR